MIHVRVTCFLRYGLGVLVVFGYVSLDQGINIDWGAMQYISINIKTNFYSYLHLLTFQRLPQFAYFSFLRVLIDSVSCIASVRPSAILEFRVSTSWPWLPGVSLLSGPKCSFLHPCRLAGQIDWHALDIDSGISPLCLQIHFCINTSFGTPGGTNQSDQYVQFRDRFREHYRGIRRRS